MLFSLYYIKVTLLRYTRMSLILPGLYICDYKDVEDPKMLLSHSITHVINCAAGLDTASFSFLKGTHKLDFEDEDDSSYLEEANKWICEGAYILSTFYEKNQTVAVHCMAGISRSPSVVIAWLILYKGMSYDDAFSLVIRRRPFIRPNPLFTRILKQLASQQV